MSWRKSKAQERYDKTKGLCSVNYQPTKNQEDAYYYCVQQNIRISPVAAEQGGMPEKWFVGISDPTDYKKVYKSRFQYDNHQIWEEVYKACEYYYDKRND